MEKEKSQVIVQNTQNKTEEHPKKNYKKGQNKQKKQKKQFKSEYVFDAEAITVDTQIPALPKKTDILKKPQFEAFKEKQKKNREKVTNLIQQKKQIREQNYKPNKTGKKGEENKHGSFKNEIQEVKELRQKFNQVKKQRNQIRDKLHKLIEEAKQNNNTLKQLGGKAHTSKQSMGQKLQKLQSKLISDTLSKDDQKNLNNEIMLLKRKIKDAESVGNIQFKISKAQQRKEQLDHQIQQLKQKKQPFEKQYTQIKELLDKKNSNIDGLKKQLDTDNKDRLQQKQENNKEWQKWKENKKKKLDQIQQRIKKINAENDKLWEEFNITKQAYWKQKNYIDWVQWQTKVKTRKINDVQKQKRNKQYQQKDKERQKQQNMQKYIGQIQLCNYLIQYLQDIKSQFNKLNQNNNNQVKQTVDISAKLAQNSEWKKQKGLQLLKSKKSKEDQQGPSKKGKKNKKRTDQKKEQLAFNIPYNVQNQFQSLKVLAPASIQQIEKKIEELKERESLFVRCCQQDQANQNDNKLIQQIKTKRSSIKNQAQQKKQQAQEFPTL